ncbi:MAG: 3,4-dehydroadipyl-CoA semialdehyde dehydrogenase, partial [Saprospiraceae bacterium]
MKLKNYTLGKWAVGKGKGQELYNAITGEVVATASTQGVDFSDMLDYGRTVGGPALRKMTFHERGRMLKALALHLHAKRKEFYPVSYWTGATKGDSWIDIDGGIGTLFAYASLRKKFPNETYYVDGEMADLSKGGSFIGQHIMVPKRGVAIHINAFNFPVWGMLEKVAVNLLAGMPAVVKPATITSYLTEVVVREIIKSKILPKGALQLICGSGRGILDHIESQDVVTFTGSATTGQMLKAHPRIISESVPFNMEADSLNCAVLGADAKPGTPEFDLFVKEVRKEMTTKCGQKCTAIRRILVPKNLVEPFQLALSAQLKKTTIGDPQVEGVRMGSLAGKVQVEEVKERIAELSKNAEIVYGDSNRWKVVGANKKEGAFMSPVLMVQPKPRRYKEVHEVEAFGPVSTIIPYKNIDDAIELANMGKGSLCCSIATNDE